MSNMTRKKNEYKIPIGVSEMYLNTKGILLEPVE